MWWVEAGKYQALPLETRDRGRGLRPRARPQLSEPRDQYIYYPGGAEIPESVAPNIRNRSYTIACRGRHRQRPDASAASSSRRGRASAAMRSTSRTASSMYAYNLVGEHVQVVASDEDLPTGHVVLSASFDAGGDRDAGDGHAEPPRP